MKTKKIFLLMLSVLAGTIAGFCLPNFVYVEIGFAYGVHIFFALIAFFLALGVFRLVPVLWIVLVEALLIRGLF